MKKTVRNIASTIMKPVRARNIVVAFAATGALLAPLAPASALEQPSGWITPVEQPVRAVTPPSQVLIDAGDRNLSVTSQVRYINGVEWVETTGGPLFSNTSGAYTRTIDPTTGNLIQLNPFGQAGDNKVGDRTIVGPHVKGAIKGLYLDGLSGPDALGYPTGYERAVSNGVVQTFRTPAGKLTDIYWSKATGAHSVSGSIKGKVGNLGGVSRTGFPKTEEFAVSGGVRQVFEKGYATWKPTTGTRWTWTV